MQLQPWVVLLLFSGTWSIYVGDRVLDARREIRSGRLDTLRQRHFFHWRHRRTLILLATLSAALAAVLVARRMPVAIRERNSLLAAAALAYFTGVHSSPHVPGWMRKIGSKELLVGVLFTAGCAAPTLWQIHFAAIGASGIWSLFTCFVFFAALAWCNCRAIERWESADGANKVSLHAGLLGIVAIGVAAAFAFFDPGASALIGAAAISSFLLLGLDRIRVGISSLLLRTLADVVLLVPAILFIFGAHRG